jgi:uncharacterized protein YchJ
MWVILLPMKVAAVNTIKHVQAAAKKQSGLKLQVLHTNNDDEFTTVEFVAYCTNEGIQRLYSTQYSPQQTDVVKRRNQTEVATTRALSSNGACRQSSR